MSARPAPSIQAIRSPSPVLPIPPYGMAAAWSGTKSSRSSRERENPPVVRTTPARACEVAARRSDAGHPLSVPCQRIGGMRREDHGARGNRLLLEEREQIADADQVRARHRHPRADLEFVRPRRSALDRGDRAGLTLHECPQQPLVGEAAAGLDHVRDEELVGVLHAGTALERRAGQREPSAAHRRTAAEPLALLDEGDAQPVRGEPVRRREAGESASDDDRVELADRGAVVVMSAPRPRRPRGIAPRRRSCRCGRPVPPPRGARASARHPRPRRAAPPPLGRPR